MKQINIEVLTEKEIKHQGDLFGIFFEDLNHAADGGLYGELVRNRSFEFDELDCKGYHALTAWETVERDNSVIFNHVDDRAPLNAENRHYLVMESMTDGGKGGIRNLGFGSGIPVEEGKRYLFSCYYRLRGKKAAPLEVRLESADGTVCYAKSRLEAAAVVAGGWQKWECTLTADATDHSGRLALLTDGIMTIELDMISLFPEDTFLGRRNGLRRDVAQLLADMKPKFMRFPGGCLAHIGSLDADDRCGMYRWKKTLGPVESRPARRNTWNYNQTLGLGFYEFFLFCEDIGAEPLPVIAAGYDPHFLRMAPLDEMQEWIDEALDLIEFANGDEDTEWGAVRAQMGHPESFHLKYLAIGNEEVGDAFFERYEIILNAVKEKYPEIQVIGSAGPGSAGSEFEHGWAQARRTETSLVDEHFYQCPEWFLANVDRYQSYPADTKAFLGEYASKDDTWKNALMEAAFMTGMEKAEGVGLACYAPMLCHVDYQNWAPNMVTFDNHRSYGSPSYYVQKQFMVYQGESLLACQDDFSRESLRSQKVPSLKGEVSLDTSRADVEVTDFLVEKKDEENYTISFCFEKKSGGTAQDLNGVNSFCLSFAKQDEQNKLTWNFDGWQRLTSLGGVYQGKECDMGLYFLEIERNHVYRAKLTVENGMITAWIDGKAVLSHKVRSVEAEDLYYSAVKDADGSVILKLVNAEPEEKEITVSLNDTEKVFSSVAISAMEHFSLDERNSLDDPCRVSPAERQQAVEGNLFTYLLPGNSFTVLRFAK